MNSLKKGERVIGLNKGFFSIMLMGSLMVASCNQPSENQSNTSSETSTEIYEEHTSENDTEKASMGYSGKPSSSDNHSKVTADLAAEKKMILKIHEDQRQAYLKKNPSLMVNHFADNITMVKNGRIDNPSVSDMKEQLQKHFEGVDYKKWDDVDPPTINISSDGTVAYVIVEKTELRVIKKTQKQETANRALVYLYKKHHGTWKVDCIASTKAGSKENA